MGRCEGVEGWKYVHDIQRFSNTSLIVVFKMKRTCISVPTIYQFVVAWPHYLLPLFSFFRRDVKGRESGRARASGLLY